MLGVCCATKYTHSSRLAGSHCAVSLFRGITPRIKIRHSGRAMCGDNTIVRQLGTGLRAMALYVKGAEENREAAHITVFLQRKEDTKKY